MFPSLVATDTPDSFADRLIANDQNLRDELFDESLGISSQSSWLYGIARTRYDNEDELPEATVDFTAADAAAIMEVEGKVTLYGYLDTGEDVATLFDHAMMRRFYNVETLVVFYDNPVDETNAECDDYIIAWGSINRSAADLVKIRSKFVMEGIMGESAAIDDFYANIGTESRFPVGDGFCEGFEAQLRPDVVVEAPPQDRPEPDTEREGTH